MRKRTCILMAAGLGLVATAGPALAHAHLKSAMPPINGQVAAAPTELDLTFTEGVNLKFTGLSIIGPDKKAVAVARPTLGASDAIIAVPVAAPLNAGTYTVNWHALAKDGHKTNGSYTFTIIQ